MFGANITIVNPLAFYNTYSYKQVLTYLIYHKGWRFTLTLLCDLFDLCNKHCAQCYFMGCNFQVFNRHRVIEIAYAGIGGEKRINEEGCRLGQCRVPFGEPIFSRT